METLNETLGFKTEQYTKLQCGLRRKKFLIEKETRKVNTDIGRCLVSIAYMYLLSETLFFFNLVILKRV